MQKEAIVHIGLHKTGTTSIQQFVQDNIIGFRGEGLDFYQGMVFPQNHVELHAATMRPERQSGYKNRSGLVVDDSYIKFVKERVAKFISETKSPRVLFSNEGLSLLRYPDEMKRLQDLLAVDNVKIIVYLRRPGDFLKSYAQQLIKVPGTLPAVINQDSFAYTEPDSWLVDFTQRVGAFKEAYGDKNVVLIDYDKELMRFGNVIPSFLDAIAVKKHFKPQDWFRYQLNKSHDKP